MSIIGESSGSIEPFQKQTSTPKSGKKVANENLPFSPNIATGRTRVKVRASTGQESESVLKTIKKRYAKPPRLSLDRLDESFIPSSSLWASLEAIVKKGVERSQDFNPSLFLAGNMANSVKTRTDNQQTQGTEHKSVQASKENEKMLQDGMALITDLVNIIASKKIETLSQQKMLSSSEMEGIRFDAYKMCVGLLDKFDDKFPDKSTFLLRNAVLLAARQEGFELESWQAFTRGGKPRSVHDIWSFVEKMQNWIPEVQGAFAKFAEIVITNAAVLAEKNSTGGETGKVYLLKGGFGAGKTRFAKTLFQETTKGIVAPDEGKKVVRRSSPTLTHSQAHIQGSQIAYAIFDDLLKTIVGDVVYDTSLSNPQDIRSYLKKAHDVGKRVVIYDVARNDIVRALSVLARTVDGDDPRILPNRILESTVSDKLNRASCMAAILEDTVPNNAKNLASEYHFLSSNSGGADSQEILTLRSGGHVDFSNTSLLNRLEAEGVLLTYDANSKQWKSDCTLDRATLKQQLALQFCQPVSELLNDVDPEIRKQLKSVFEKRVFEFVRSPHDLNEFYNGLPQKLQDALPYKELKNAFNQVPERDMEAFFKRIASSTKISYLDLPLGVALYLNAKLSQDPWKEKT
jgi:predicted kinase